MAQPYVGEIRMFAGNFAPAGWMFCEGQLLADLRVRDALQSDRDDLWRRRPEHLRPARPARPDSAPSGQGRLYTSSSAETGGAEEITLTVTQMPAHRHAMLASRDRRERRIRSAQRRARRRRRHRRVRPGDAPAGPMTAAPIGPGRRQPAARQLPALPLRRLHHLAVRHLPVPDLRDVPWPIHSSPRSASSLQLRARGLGVVRRPAPAALAEHGAFSLLGTTYGGDGKSNFALPDLQGARRCIPAGPGPVACTIWRDRRQRDT